jgi:hypothetical protein
LPRVILKPGIFDFMFLFLYLILLISSAFSPTVKHQPERQSPDSVQNLYHACGAGHHIRFSVFKKSLEGYCRYRPANSVLAIADMGLPSGNKRLFVFDLKKRKLIATTWVAHGKNSGMALAKSFSNEPNSYKTSPGFYEVGKEIVSPKHGPALMLEGLEKGKNDKARQREIIIHGADYVGAGFIRKYGRCGRSHGCPAIPKDMVSKLFPILEGGSLLYIHRSDE